MYLLDTNVISEIRKGKKGDVNVMLWAKNILSSSLFLSVITILELEIGILLKERKDPLQSSILRTWLKTQVLPAFGERILVIDTAIAQRCAALHTPNKISERDALIAATALVHGMTIVTRNTKDFKATGALLYNPWEVCESRRSLKCKRY